MHILCCNGIHWNKIDIVYNSVTKFILSMNLKANYGLYNNLEPAIVKTVYNIKIHQQKRIKNNYMPGQPLGIISSQI